MTETRTQAIKHIRTNYPSERHEGLLMALDIILMEKGKQKKKVLSHDEFNEQMG